MADGPPPLPSRATANATTFRGQFERLSTLPERQSPAFSDRTVGNADELGLEPDATWETWYDVVSTWLNRVSFWPKSHFGGPPTPQTKDLKQRTGYLRVEFLDGAVIEYSQPEPYSTFDNLIGSPSKGYYVHHAETHLYTKPYRTISPKTRRVTAEMRRLREPKANRRGGQRLIGLQSRPPRPPSFH